MPTLGLVRPEDEPEQEAVDSGEPGAKVKPPFSASLIESLTAIRSLSISAALVTHHDVALAVVVHALVTAAYLSGLRCNETCLQLVLKSPNLRESCKGKEALEVSFEAWRLRLPQGQGQLWNWCIAQERETLLELLAFCAAHLVDGTRRKVRP